MPIDVRPTVPNHQNRRAAELSRNLEKRLVAYVAAAGGGLIVFSQPAAAQIIYTPSNIPMAQGFAGGAITQFDINNDGTPDFAFSNFSYLTHGFGAVDLKISPDVTGNAIVGILLSGQQRTTAAALADGVEVGPNANFQSQGLYMAGVFFGSTNTLHSGSWLSVETAYLGLKFMVNGETHYGWARIKFVSPVGFNFLSGSIAGYAYESTPNQPILTGQTSGTMKKTKQPGQPNAAVRIVPAARAQSLGMLAAGAVATPLWRGKTSGEQRTGD